MILRQKCCRTHCFLQYEDWETLVNSEREERLEFTFPSILSLSLSLPPPQHTHTHKYIYLSEIGAVARAFALFTLLANTISVTLKTATVINNILQSQQTTEQLGTVTF